MLRGKRGENKCNTSIFNPLFCTWSLSYHYMRWTTYLLHTDTQYFSVIFIYYSDKFMRLWSAG
jgi:hypothetical protein